MIHHDDPRRAILDHVVVPRRSTVVNDGLTAARTGAITPAAVRAALIAAWERRLAYAERHGDRLTAYDAADILAVLGGHREEASQFAAWCLDWAGLPPDEREAVKAARAEEHRRSWLAEQPPTEKQAAYCRSLGYRGEIRSRAHASAIIETLRQRRAS